MSAVRFLETAATAALSDGSATVRSYQAGAAVAAGDFVTWDNTETGAVKTMTVIQCTTGAIPCGVALDAAAAAGDVIRVVRAGYVASCNVATGTAAGATVAVNTVAGRAQAYVNTNTVTICATTCTLAAANVADAIIVNSFGDL